MGFLKTAAPRGFLMFCALSLLSCEVDNWGRLFSTDLEDRLKDKNTYNFLSAGDLAIELPEEYSFVVLSDTHINDDTRGLENIASILIAGDKFMVVDGDISDNGNLEYMRKFVDIFKDLKNPAGERVPCYPVLGNHDMFFGNWEVWRTLIGSSSYRAGGEGSSTGIIVLDSASAYLGAYQADFLDMELGRNFKHQFIFTHTSLFLNPELNWTQTTDWTDLQERARFIKIASGRADGVFTGHLHERVIQEAGGTPYITLEDWKEKRVYVRVFVRGEGITYEFKIALKT